MTTAQRLLCGLVVCSVALGSCSLTRSRPHVRYYALTLNVPEVSLNPGTMSLVVQPFTARDPYNQERIVYRSSPYQLDFYYSHRWAASPAEMVTDWTRRYLGGTAVFAKVFPTDNGNADLTLGGVIRQFEQIDHEETWDATLSIDFWLARAGQRSPFWFQSYTATKQAARRNPEAIAEAMSRNLEDILARLAADFPSAMAASPTP